MFHSPRHKDRNPPLRNLNIHLVHLPSSDTQMSAHMPRTDFPVEHTEDPTESDISRWYTDTYHTHNSATFRGHSLLQTRQVNILPRKTHPADRKYCQNNKISIFH